MELGRVARWFHEMLSDINNLKYLSTSAAVLEEASKLIVNIRCIVERSCPADVLPSVLKKRWCRNASSPAPKCRLVSVAEPRRGRHQQSMMRMWRLGWLRQIQQLMMLQPWRRQRRRQRGRHPMQPSRLVCRQWLAKAPSR